MKIASEFAQHSIEELKPLFDGGTLTIYSVAHPISADRPVDRSSVLATFTFASPAFGAPSDGFETPNFVANPTPGVTVGTPGFARARTKDGATIADFSAGPGDREIKFSEVSCTHGAPLLLTKFKFALDGGWPERPDYYETKPRSGYPMPSTL